MYSSSACDSAKTGGVHCAVCPKRAFKSCLTCAASFCEDHVKHHYSAPALQRHKLVDATEDLQQRLCPRHHRELELYCTTDQTSICALCVAKEHIGHDIVLGEHQVAYWYCFHIWIDSIYIYECERVKTNKEMKFTQCALFIGTGNGWFRHGKQDRWAYLCLINDESTKSSNSSTGI